MTSKKQIRITIFLAIILVAVGITFIPAITLLAVGIGVVAYGWITSNDDTDDYNWPATIIGAILIVAAFAVGF